MDILLKLTFVFNKLLDVPETYIPRVEALSEPSIGEMFENMFYSDALLPVLISILVFLEICFILMETFDKYYNEKLMVIFGILAFLDVFFILRKIYYLNFYWNLNIILNILNIILAAVAVVVLGYIGIFIAAIFQPRSNTLYIPSSGGDETARRQFFGLDDGRNSDLYKDMKDVTKKMWDD